MTMATILDERLERDRLTASARSQLMGRIGSKNTRPELRVRRAAHALGLRYRLHGRKLAGSPDLVLPRHRTALFVHGCFWHRHAGCPRSSSPRRNADFWQAKFARNVARDADVRSTLESQGWRVLVIWECETKSKSMLEEKLADWFPARSTSIGASETLDNAESTIIDGR